MAYTNEERQRLWDQFAQVHGESQEAYDNSVRAMGAAGVAITASLATALHGISASGIAAIALFLMTLILNLGSYVSAQRDMRARTQALREKDDERVERTGWTAATTWLNGLAGAGVVAGGALLAAYIATSA